jgi:hypothetical protein
MDKRFQIFISSTFTDLQEERAAVQNMIMKLGYIPAGMELFPAIDEEQLDFIKRIIDDSDYYLLIIGGRYGSIGKDGISYTEKEYDYAVERKMKVIALIHEDPQSLSFSKSEKDRKARKSLESFKQKVKKGRMVLFWKDSSELPAKLAQSLPVTITTYPAVGWVRASAVPGPEVYKELNDLRKENDSLKKDLEKSFQISNSSNVADLEHEVEITIMVGVRTTYAEEVKKEKVKTTWGTIFNALAPSAFTEAKEGTIKRKIGEVFASKIANTDKFSWVDVGEESINAIRIQFRALDLVNLTPYEKVTPGRTERGIVWSLTPTGEKIFVIGRAYKRD